MIRRSARALLVVPVLIASAACGPSKDPVVALLDDIVAAASDRDADDVAKHLSEDFSADGTGKAETMATIRQYLGAYQALDVSYSDLEKVVKEDSARAKFKLHASGVPRNLGGLGDMLPRSATYDVELVLRKDGDHWLVTQAKWTESQ